MPVSVPKAQESTIYQLSGRVIKVVGGISNPNGVILSPDEKTLYANNKDREHYIQEPCRSSW